MNEKWNGGLQPAKSQQDAGGTFWKETERTAAKHHEWNLQRRILVCYKANWQL